MQEESEREREKAYLDELKEKLANMDSEEQLFRH